MELLKLCQNILPRLLLVLVIISSFIAPPAFCQDTEDSQVFIAGFNAYQQRDFATSIEKMSEVLKKYPDTPLRDMALFWLSRSYYKAGNQQEAARYLSQFSKEYPDNPLKSTVEDELLALTTRYESGEKLPTGSPIVKKSDQRVAQKTKPEKSRIAAAKAEETRRTAVAAEAARIDALKRAEQNAAAEKKESERVTAAKAEAARVAAAESERMAAARLAEEKASAEKKENERLAAIKAEEVKKAAEQAEQQRLIAAKIAEETKQKAAAKAAEEEAKKVAAVKAEKARLASIEQERMRAVAASETARIAAEKVELERIATAKAEEIRLATAAAESARLASIKAEEERKAADRLAAEEENRRISAFKSEEKNRSEKLEYREKAIAQYKSIIDKFPASTAAATAVAKLRELGITVALPLQTVGATLAENAQVLRLEVAQFAGFEFNLLPRHDVFIVNQAVSIPFELINRGNGKDSFSFESAFPNDFKVAFASVAEPGTVINQTPDLAVGETFKGVINLTIPSGSIDGLRIIHPVKVVSHLMPEASQSREVRLVASAPLLRAVLRTDKVRPLPGENVVYSVAILNVGSTAAQDVTFRLNFSQQLEPQNFTTAGFKQDAKSSLIFDGLQLKSGENREFKVTFLLKDDSLAGQELLTRADLINNKLKATATFVSNIANVESRRGIAVRTGLDKLVAIPGQTIAVPFVVTNTGNLRERFKIATVLSGAKEMVLFNDINRDGIRQDTDPLINEIGPLAPREEASVVAEIKTPNSAADASQGKVQLSFISEGDATRSASGTTQLLYSRPVLKMDMVGRDGRLKPGDVASFDLTMTNSGSNLARTVELQSVWPDQLELVAADPAANSANKGIVIWRFKEVGAAEKRSIKVSFRVKPGIGVGTAIQVKNILTYEDQMGNRY